jgi:uncharacterized membrane protein HdeD (DUF308 family)
MTIEETAKPTDEGGVEVTTKIGADEVAALDQQTAWAAKNWGIVLFSGILALIFGAIVLSNIFTGLTTLVWLLGFYLLYAGIVDIATSSAWGSRALAIVVGIIAIIAGLAVIVHPSIGLKTIPLLMGIAFIVWGLARIVAALANKESHRIWSGIYGVLLIVAGGVAIANPWAADVIITWLMGFSALFYGIFGVISSFSMKNAKKNWEAQKAQLKQT